MPTTTPTPRRGRGGRPKQYQREAVQFVGGSESSSLQDTAGSFNTGGGVSTRTVSTGFNSVDGGSGALRQQQQGQFNYINRKTMQKQQSSSDPKDRVHTNPFHQTWSAREAIAKTKPTPTTAPLATRGRNKQHTPNFQLSALGSSTISTPPTLNWSKRHLNTPLNKMMKGNNSNWKETSDKVQVTIPKAQPFPPGRKAEWNRVFHTLHPIPEEQDTTQTHALNPTVIGPSKPTPEMYELAETLTSKAPTTIRLADITTTGSPVGISVATAIIMDVIKGHILPTGTITQYHNMAHFLMASSSEALLNYLRDEEKLAAFVHNRMLREDILPPFSEHTLHPGVTPGLAYDPEIITRVYHQVANRADYSNIIVPFVERFYPSETSKVRTAIQQGKLNDHLRDIVLTPGYFASYWYPEGGESGYDPPIWVDLHFQADNEQTLTQTRDSFDDGENPGILDGFTPLYHMGKAVTDIMNMTPQDQKKHALLTLPSILKQLVTTEVVADIMIKLAMIPDEDFPSYLQPEGFQRCVEQENMATGMEEKEEYRVRLRFRQDQTRRTMPPGTALKYWLGTVQTMMGEIDITMKIIPQPYDTEGTHILLNDTTPDVDILNRYTQSIKSGEGTFDVWCITSCPTWGRFQFPYEDTNAGTVYNAALSTQGIMISSEESYNADLTPCVALIGSDSRDRDDIIHAEYMDQLTSIGIEPTFQVIWCSLRNTQNRSAMFKCIATTEEHRDMVMDAFQKIRKSTRTKLYQATDTYDMHPIPGLQTIPNESEITEIIMNQRVREEEHTRVTLTGLNRCDPYTIRPLNSDGTQSEHTIAEMFLMGMDNHESHSPVVKVTTDRALSCCYLTARKEDAQELIDFAHCVAPDFAKWVGSEKDVRVLTPLAEKWVQKPPLKSLPVTTIDTPATVATSALTTTTKTFEMSVNDRLDNITTLLTSQGALIQQLLQQRSDRDGTQDSIVQAVKTTMTTAITTLQTDMATKHSDQSSAMELQLATLSSSITDTVKATFTSQQETAKLLYELIEQYDSTIETVNDCTMAYGNEIAMLRVVMDACTHRVNWLVEDIGSNTVSKPEPPTTDKLSAAGMDRIMDAVHDVYSEGQQRVDVGTAVADRSIELIQAQEKQQAGAAAESKKEGRQREQHAAQPPLATQGPTKTPQTPPIPVDQSPTTTKGGSGSGTTHEYGVEGHTVGKKGGTEIPDVPQPPTPHQSLNKAETQTEKALDRKPRRGNCSCCGRGSYALVECGTCGQDFHKLCTKLDAKSMIATCTRCREEYDREEESMEGAAVTQGLGGKKPPKESEQPLDSSDMEEESSSSSSENTTVSSFSQSPLRKRKTKSKLKTPTKYTKILKASTPVGTSITASPRTEMSSEDMNDKKPDTTIKRRPHKTTQSTLTRRPDTGTIQLTSSKTPRLRTHQTYN